MQSAWLNYVESSFPNLFQGNCFNSIHNILLPSEILRHDIYTWKGIFFSYPVFTIGSSLPFSILSLPFFLLQEYANKCSNRSLYHSCWCWRLFSCFTPLLELRVAGYPQLFLPRLGKGCLSLAPQLCCGFHGVSFASGYVLRLQLLRLGDPRSLNRDFHFRNALFWNTFPLAVFWVLQSGIFWWWNVDRTSFKHPANYLWYQQLFFLHQESPSSERQGSRMLNEIH